MSAVHASVFTNHNAIMRATLLASGITSVLPDASIKTFPNSLTLSASSDPIKAGYWTGLPHHRRTPFSVSPDGKSAYLAYFDDSYTKVYVQQVSVDDFTAVGEAVSVTAYEAAGLVAQDDGFALMATINATSTTDANNAPSKYHVLYIHAPIIAILQTYHKLTVAGSIPSLKERKS
ncbi:hypothetical protein ACMFMF_001523 [Clarireedia jacksonii]